MKNEKQITTSCVGYTLFHKELLIMAESIKAFLLSIPVNLLLLGAGIIGGIIIRFIFYRFIKFQSSESANIDYHSFKKRTSSVSTFFIPILFSFILLVFFGRDTWYFGFMKDFLRIGLIITASWFLIKLLYVFEEIILSKYDIRKEDNIQERKILTQLNFLKKLGIVIIVIIGLSVMLLSIKGGKELGAGLITSAGVASIIIGFAAQKSISNLIAGVQIAFTQPIRIDDAVFVENEWGNIEEINLTYVVVKIWDLRRLVLPINYFVENPFQNWTKNEANLLGSVYLYIDYRIPVEDLRRQLLKILEKEPLWDKKGWVLQMIDLTESTAKLRALMTAKNAPEAWELRCSVREKLVSYISEKYPEYLPRTRIFLQNPNG